MQMIGGLAILRRVQPLRRRLPAAMSVALLVGAALFAGGASGARADNPPNGITVTGSGTASVTPDEAHVSGSVETQAATASDALGQNSQTLNAVIAAVKASGVTDADIQTTNLSIYPIFSQPEAPANGGPTPPPTVVGFHASEGIRVRVTDLTTVGDLIQTMVTAGINNFNGVDYGLQDPEQLRTMALQAAIADAQAQAQAAAASTGVKLGGILNLTVNGSSAPPVPRAAVALASAAPSPAPPPILPGPLTASTNVTITFAILGP